MHRPITSRVRDNKNISKDPARQPILHVGNVSPLKQTLVVTTEETIPGQDAQYEDVATGEKKAPTAPGGAQWQGAAGDYLKTISKKDKLKGLSGKALADEGWISEAYIDDWNELTNYTPPTEKKLVKEGTPPQVKKEEVPLLTRDKSTALTPYQQYQAKLMYNRAGRAEKGSERKQQRDLAKEYARQKEKDGNLYQKFKARRDVMTGRASLEDFETAFGSKEAGLKRFGQAVQNYEVSRGLSDDQQSASASAEGARRQYNERRPAGSSITSKDRLATPPDINRADVQGQINAKGGDVDFKPGQEGAPRVYTSTDTIGGSALKMMDRHMNSVGMKQSSALKKGYFKGK